MLGILGLISFFAIGGIVLSSIYMPALTIWMVRLLLVDLGAIVVIMLYQRYEALKEEKNNDYRKY